MIKPKSLLIIATVLVTIAMIIVTISKSNVSQPVSDVPPPDTLEIPQPTLLYGFEIDSFDTTSGTVKFAQNLSEILSEHNVGGQPLFTLANRAKDIYSVRKIKAGSDYTIIHERDSLKTARQFIFEPHATEYVVYHFADSIYAEVVQKPIEIREKSVAGEINSSLYNAILDQEGSPLLVNKLVDVFAWQVDFFRIAPGDQFKIIYEEVVVEDKVVGIGAIKGAYFDHRSKPYYAIPYLTEEKVDFFDEEGKSLRKTFLKAPLNYNRISSRYSPRRYHPVLKRYKAHLGTDYAAPTGTPIRTVGDGVVLEASYAKGNGNYVKIKHNSNYTTQYLHMSKIASGIKRGVQVEQGKTIGYVGSTGLATGPHLCFRFWKNGRQVDPMQVDLPSSKGIADVQLPQYLVFADSVKQELNKIRVVQKELMAEVPSN